MTSRKPRIVINFTDRCTKHLRREPGFPFGREFFEAPHNLSLDLEKKKLTKSNKSKGDAQQLSPARPPSLNPAPRGVEEHGDIALLLFRERIARDQGLRVK